MLYYIITYYIILYYIILYYQKGTPPGPTKYIARNLCYTYIICDIYIYLRAAVSKSTMNRVSPGTSPADGTHRRLSTLSAIQRHWFDGNSDGNVNGAW